MRPWETSETHRCWTPCAELSQSQGCSTCCSQPDPQAADEIPSHKKCTQVKSAPCGPKDKWIHTKEETKVWIILAYCSSTKQIVATVSCRPGCRCWGLTLSMSKKISKVRTASSPASDPSHTQLCFLETLSHCRSPATSCCPSDAQVPPGSQCSLGLPLGSTSLFSCSNYKSKRLCLPTLMVKQPRYHRGYDQDKLSKAGQGLKSPPCTSPDGTAAPVCQQRSGMSTAADFTNHRGHIKWLELGISGQQSSSLQLH